jgi:hypothetical protein
VQVPVTRMTGRGRGARESIGKNGIAGVSRRVKPLPPGAAERPGPKPATVSWRPPYLPATRPRQRWARSQSKGWPACVTMAVITSARRWLRSCPTRPRFRSIAIRANPISCGYATPVCHRRAPFARTVAVSFILNFERKRNTEIYDGALIPSYLSASTRRLSMPE